ncbi:unnamed protein product [Zymoseptoria tritici ST99CH_1E4]|uniref:Protein STB3 n=1 Tax=Zymoseptoria tritici ST99CH_1E4 TaxID=1276532 RepID=A0A2H1GBK8_ZYMTR|nr:unnamed protein product [Zymoseptoria tritici ST99CH_1E4]
MAQLSSIAQALAVQTSSVAIPNARSTAADYSGTANFEKAANALLTPPSSISPQLQAQRTRAAAFSPPPNNMSQDTEMEDSAGEYSPDLDNIQPSSTGMPLSLGALSDLDNAVTITPSMLAKQHLPGIMLGNGPRPIRYVMGELCQTVPGFSRIAPAKARRIVVAALGNPAGGGPNGDVVFSKTGWGRWDAHIKGSSRDSAIGSFNEGNLSPPRSEQGSYAMSHSDSAIHMHAQHMNQKYREGYSGGSWTASSIREEDELDMDMDPVEDAADNMSLDGDSSDSSSEELNEDTDDEDWAAVGIEALRKASMSTSNVTPRQNIRVGSIPYNGPWASKSWQRPTISQTRSLQSASVPDGANFRKVDYGGVRSVQTPEEQAAVAALLSLGSM